MPCPATLRFLAANTARGIIHIGTGTKESTLGRVERKISPQRHAAEVTGDGLQREAGTKMAALAEAKYIFCGQLTIYRSEVRVILIYGDS